jgi:hypothetical protein
MSAGPEEKRQSVLVPSSHSSYHEKEELSSDHPAVADDPAGQQPRSTPNDVEAKGSSVNVPVSAPTAPGHVNDLSSVPNGGLTAWLQVVGGFFLFFNTWYVQAFGEYFAEYLP